MTSAFEALYLSELTRRGVASTDAHALASWHPDMCGIAGRFNFNASQPVDRGRLTRDDVGARASRARTPTASTSATASASAIAG